MQRMRYYDLDYSQKTPSTISEFDKTMVVGAYQKYSYRVAKIRQLFIPWGHGLRQYIVF